MRISWLFKFWGFYRKSYTLLKYRDWLAYVVVCNSCGRQVDSKGLFTWRWGTLGRWGNPPSRGRKIERVYMQSYNPGVLGWGFLRLLLRLQLRSLSRGVPSSHLEKDERLILGHICIYSWKRKWPMASILTTIAWRKLWNEKYATLSFKRSHVQACLHC